MVTLLALGAYAQTIGSGLTALVGVGATLDNDPATMKIALQGETSLIRTPVAGVGLVFPIELTTTNDHEFGLSSDETMLTFVPSVRLRAASALPVRFYGDLGAGVGYITARRDTWLLDDESSRSGLATRFALGVEAGPPGGGIAVVVEPLDVDTLHFEGHESVGYTGRVGIGIRR